MQQNTFQFLLVYTTLSYFFIVTQQLPLLVVQSLRLHALSVVSAYSEHFPFQAAISQFRFILKVRESLRKCTTLIVTSHLPLFGHGSVNTLTQNGVPFVQKRASASSWRSLPQACRWSCRETPWRTVGNHCKMIPVHKSSYLWRELVTHNKCYNFLLPLWNFKLEIIAVVSFGKFISWKRDNYTYQYWTYITPIIAVIPFYCCHNALPQFPHLAFYFSVTSAILTLIHQMSPHMTSSINHCPLQ